MLIIPFLLSLPLFIVIVNVTIATTILFLLLQPPCVPRWYTTRIGLFTGLQNNNKKQ